MDRDRWKKLLALSPTGKTRQIERRKFRRYGLQLELLEVNGKKVTDCFLVDLSVSGARLELSFSPPLLSSLAIRCHIPSQVEPMTLHGRVVWTKPGLIRNRFVVGMQFYQLHWEIEKLLEQPCR